jgi:acyl carrier protein
MDRKDILEKVKKELIYNRLKLEDIGINLEEVTDNVSLFGTEGLGLSSVDVLELMMGIQKEYGVKIEKINEEVAKKYFSTPNTITDYIMTLIREQKKN